MKQFTRLTSKASFSMKLDGTRGCPVNVKIGDKFVITNPEYSQTMGIMVDRENRARPNSGYMLDIHQVQSLFTIGE